jgi:hypothetical protein
MELIAHVLLAGTVFGFSLSLLLGTSFPDILFVLAYIYKKNARMHMAGEYLHSIFLAPLTILIAFIAKSDHLMLFGFGYGTHILTDLFVHKQDGSRYLYPLTSRKINSGPFYWRSKRFIAATYIILIIALIIKYRG